MRKKTYLERSLNVTQACIDRVIAVSKLSRTKLSRPPNTALSLVFAAKDQFPRNVSSGEVRENGCNSQAQMETFGLEDQYLPSLGKKYTFFIIVYTSIGHQLTLSL